METSEDYEGIRRLTRDLLKASATLGQREARYLVDVYYQMQDNRIRATHQERTLAVGQEPNAVVDWLRANAGVFERNIKRALGGYSQGQVVGRWAESIVGIGPVISAGLLAHINLEPWRCLRGDRRKTPCEPDAPCTPACGRIIVNTAGKVWRFAGLDPTAVWGKGERRPWNAALKRLCWLIGESFVKQQANKHDFYGQLYVQRKAQEESRNAEGCFRAQAEESLAAKRWARDTVTRKAYEEGRLPQARIHLRACRHATKIFLSHWHQVAYFDRFGELLPRPYVLDILGHADLIQVPNWPFGK